MPGGAAAMRGTGALLILLGSAMAWVLHRRETTRAMRIGEALLGDLAVLRYHVCVCRDPLPEILGTQLCGGLGAEHFWGPLLDRLEEEKPLALCWAEAAGALPAPLDRMLAPVGPMLAAGGGLAERSIEETREELTRFIRAEHIRQVQSGRLSAALCLSGACLLILVLI